MGLIAETNNMNIDLMHLESKKNKILNYNNCIIVYFFFAVISNR